jgi:hypothetical protein
VITPAPAPAPSIVFSPVSPAPAAPPAPSLVVARPVVPPVDTEKKSKVVESETPTVVVVVPPVIGPEPQLPPAEITTQIVDLPEAEVAKVKVATRMIVTKLPKAKATAPISFALGMFDKGSNKVITDFNLVAGVKVLSKTPKVCTVSTTFDKKSSKYVIRVNGLSIGQCRIAAVDKGNEEKLGSTLQIEQTITKITAKKS